MSQQVIPVPLPCAPQCTPITTSGIPGNPGDPGDDGTNGTDGVNAFTTVEDYTPAGQPVMPAEGSDVTVECTSSTSFLAVGEIAFFQVWGYMLVISFPSDTSVEVQNPADVANDIYPDNAAPGTTLAAASRIVPGGVQGPTGTVTGAFADQTLSNLTSAAAARGNLGLGTVATFTQGNNDTQIPKIDDAGNLTNGEAIFATASGIESKTASAARTALGAQALDATLTSLAALGTAADKMAYTTGVDTWAETAITVLARTLIASNTAPVMLAAMGAKAVNQGRICLSRVIDLSISGDIAISMLPLLYRIDEVVLFSATTSLTTATVGLFTAIGGGGTTIAANQAAAALTAADLFLSLALDAVVTTNSFNNINLQFRVGTTQAGPAFVTVLIFGTVLE